MACCGGGGGGSASNTSTIYTSNNLPGWVTDEAKKNYETAKTLSDRAYPTYGGQRIAQLNPDQQRALEMTRTSMGQWQPQMQQAGQVAQNIATTGFQDANLDAYMNPFRQQVIDASVSEANRQADIQRKQLARSAPTASAWAGGRQAILEAEHGRNTGDNINRMVAGLNSDAYQQAVAAYNADRASQLQGANLMGNLAGAGQALGFADINALLQTGGMLQGQEQANLDLGYADFLNQYNHPLEMLNLKTAALNATPYSTSTQQTSTGAGTPTAEPNFIPQLVGGLGLLASGANKWF